MFEILFVFIQSYHKHNYYNLITLIGAKYYLELTDLQLNNHVVGIEKILLSPILYEINTQLIARSLWAYSFDVAWNLIALVKLCHHNNKQTCAHIQWYNSLLSYTDIYTCGRAERVLRCKQHRKKCVNKNTITKMCITLQCTWCDITEFNCTAKKLLMKWSYIDPFDAICAQR